MTTTNDTHDLYACCAMHHQTGQAHDFDCPLPLGGDTWQARSDERRKVIRLRADGLARAAEVRS